MDILNYLRISINKFWISENEYRISINEFRISINTFKDILKYAFWISKNCAELRISINQF